MTRDEAQKLLQVAQDELGGIPHGHQTHVLNAYAQLYGFDDDAQLRLAEPHSREVAAPTPIRPQPTVPRETVAKARASDPATSHKAALDNAPRRSSQRGRILETLVTVQVGKAWLAEEISDQTGLPLNSVSTRMSELVAGEWVSGAGPKRQTRNGEMATAYVPTYKALEHFRQEADQALAAA
jgi:hypothetical protein